jgi:Uma2 family endonuclease
MVSARTGEVIESIGDLLAELGGVSPDRVRLRPAAGRATVADVVRLHRKSRRLFELVDGTLVEKPMGAKGSFLAMRLGKLISNYSDAHGDLGMLLGPDGMVRLMEKLVRIPDVSFTLWSRVPGRTVPAEAVPDLAPDLAVEVLSESNTPAEMERKLKEYFLSEVQLVWFVDPKARTVTVYTSPDEATTLSAKDALTGGDLLPGFAVKVADLFAQLPADAPAPKAAKPKPAKKAKKRT